MAGLAPNLTSGRAERYLDAARDPLICERKPNTILLLRVQDANQDVLLCRYSNCYRGYADTLHAEQVMMQDLFTHLLAYSPTHLLT